MSIIYHLETHFRPPVTSVLCRDPFSFKKVFLVFDFSSFSSISYRSCYHNHIGVSVLSYPIRPLSLPLFLRTTVLRLPDSHVPVSSLSVSGTPVLSPLLPDSSTSSPKDLSCRVVFGFSRRSSGPSFPRMTKSLGPRSPLTSLPDEQLKCFSFPYGKRPEDLNFLFSVFPREISKFTRGLITPYTSSFYREGTHEECKRCGALST